ncbi:unnamed protein product [Dovyalis caffra]|uniref:Uncharacterized protein n=1 Tax=Dovyalis caffra TaxID=77055 RepID=A0AAV1S8K7_9ROSI|nr:unnamed protein product [Dovyalis caffra]
MLHPDEWAFGGASLLKTDLVSNTTRFKRQTAKMEKMKVSVTAPQTIPRANDTKESLARIISDGTCFIGDKIGTARFLCHIQRFQWLFNEELINQTKTRKLEWYEAFD